MTLLFLMMWKLMVPYFHKLNLNRNANDSKVDENENDYMETDR